MEAQQAEIEAIVNNPKPPTFENTILAFDRTGKLLSQVMAVFGTIQGANTSPELQKIALETTPLTSQHRSSIYLNDRLFARLKSVYDRRNQIKLGPEEKFLLEKSIRISSGQELFSSQKPRIDCVRSTGNFPCYP